MWHLMTSSMITLYNGLHLEYTSLEETIVKRISRQKSNTFLTHLPKNKIKEQKELSLLKQISKNTHFYTLILVAK